MSLESELSKLRNDTGISNLLLKKTATIINRGTFTANDYGNPTYTGGTTTVSCAVNPISGRGASSDDISLAREAETNFYKIIFPYGTSVNDNDKIIIDGVTYNPEAIAKEHSFGLFVTVVASVKNAN